MRKRAGEDTIILQGSYRGTFAVPIDWTDQMVDVVTGDEERNASFLSARLLLDLADLIEQIRKRGLDT